ncbi:DUF2975 domain-containing protein [Vitellibacter sp. q18]|jgi:hypothetical protein|nr:DUF2975 domain-containing protein [Aequorivita lutea]
MKKTNNLIFYFLLVIAWIIFVGLGIEAGGLAVNFVFSLVNPEVLPKLYQKLDLLPMLHRSQWAFYGMYSFILAIALLKAIMFYTVIMLMHRMNLEKPFSSFVSNQISRISYFTFSIGLLSYIASGTARNLQKRGYDVDALGQFWVDSEAYILMAAIIYIIAVIFAKGIEIQQDNELTI